MEEKIGIGIVTCRRPEFFVKCLNSLQGTGYDELIIVNDSGTQDDEDHYKAYEKEERDSLISLGDHTYIRHKDNMGVGFSKNEVFKHLLKEGCDHIFVMEDDIFFKDPDTLNLYVEYSKKTGIQHFLFGYHGPANRGAMSYGKPTPRTIIDYGKGIQVALNMHCVGALCYYSRDSLAKQGLFDERFKNAWEHVHHSYKLVKANYCPAYWWWPDIANSYDLIGEQACSEVNSSIRREPEWHDTLRKGAEWFHQDFGYYPTTVPNLTLTEVKQNLKKIYEQKSLVH